MSKNKGGKRDKKAPNAERSKQKSDYQSGKTNSTLDGVNPFSKRKKQN